MNRVEQEYETLRVEHEEAVRSGNEQYEYEMLSLRKQLLEAQEQR